jgi:predicted GIY-YIG superfamily endonuclease
MTTNLYVLKLEGGNYYVGKTANLDSRIAQHMGGHGSAWTRKYKPVSVIEKIKNASHFDEDSKTEEYMSKYGIDKVRGGSYMDTNLSDEQRAHLQKKIRAATDVCIRCGRDGHFIGSCYARTDVDGNSIEEVTPSPQTITKKELTEMVTKVVAQVVAKKEHSQTVTQSTVKGGTKKRMTPQKVDLSDEDEYECDYCDRTFTTAFGCRVHERSCQEKEDACYRCGREGHYSPDCYASRHVNGRTLR